MRERSWEQDIQEERTSSSVRVPLRSSVMAFAGQLRPASEHLSTSGTTMMIYLSRGLASP